MTTQGKPYWDSLPEGRREAIEYSAICSMKGQLAEMPSTLYVTEEEL